MAVSGTKYTVVGFGSRLDWRPTVFVDGFPPTKVCSACGVVPSMVALLPCRHVLCRRCYAPSGDVERSRCPLDNDVHEVEDVTWSSTTKDKLLKCKITCWNSANGCGALGTVREILDHFEDCRCHTVTCIHCKKSMAYNELCGHLETDCRVAEEFPGNRSDGTSDAFAPLFAERFRQLEDKLTSLQTCCNETKQLIAGHAQLFRERAAAHMLVAESVQTLGDTLKESLDQTQVAAGRNAQELAAMQNSMGTILNTLVEVVVLAKETKASLNTSSAETTGEVSALCRNLQRKFNDFAASSEENLNHKLDIDESLKRLNERLNGDVCDKLSVLVNGVKATLQNTLSISEPFIFTIEKWSILKQVATQQGEAAALADRPEYFYGYSILLGVTIIGNGNDRGLHLCYQICRGVNDLLLTWPFQKELHCYVLNAEGKEIPEYITANSTVGINKADVEMPTGERSPQLGSRASIKITDIERRGCVTDDKVSIKFKVVSL
ncbi:TNF receptor-associated factor 2-like [Haemaphysalis longicornis]